MAVVFSFNAFMGVVAFVLGLPAVLFGVLGVLGAIRQFARKGAAVAGFVLGNLSSVIAAIWMTVLSAALSSADRAFDSEHKAEFRVTTNGMASVGDCSGKWLGPTRRSDRHFRPGAAAGRVRAGSPRRSAAVAIAG
ncbi:hypothetical protein [Arthrobacter sp. CG_A4]|uniref:hypothetical protein n=1 Tax=Arthrobacter sp. CG_A4 TaxID=3071706 RepID=UPI002E15D114